MNWTKLITCKMADLTREGQPRGNEISGDDDLAGMGTLQEALHTWVLEAYHKPRPGHGLGPIPKGPKLGGPPPDHFIMLHGTRESVWEILLAGGEAGFTLAWLADDPLPGPSRN